MGRNRGIRLGKSRGIKVGGKIVRILKWVIHRKRKSSPHYQHLILPSSQSNNHRQNNNEKTISKLCKLGQSIKRGAKEKLCFLKQRRRGGYIRVGQTPADETKRVVGVPKGHLAVYVGEKEDESRRVLVPVIYLNHPLFGELLKEAEKVYGFNHPGKIVLPCPISDFEYVKTEIDATGKDTRCCRPWLQLRSQQQHHHQQGLKYIAL